MRTSHHFYIFQFIAISNTNMAAKVFRLMNIQSGHSDGRKWPGME